MQANPCTVLIALCEPNSNHVTTSLAHQRYAQCKPFHAPCPIALCKQISNPSDYFSCTPTVNAPCKPFRAPSPIALCNPICNPSHYFSCTPTGNAQCKTVRAPYPIALCKPISNPPHYFSCTPTVNAQCNPSLHHFQLSYASPSQNHLNTSLISQRSMRNARRSVHRVQFPCQRQPHRANTRDMNSQKSPIEGMRVK